MVKNSKSRPAPFVPEQTGTLIGYARVSTQDQNLALQIDALERAGVRREFLFTEKVSGASKRRPQRAAARRQCGPGDTFCVWRLDRVGRSLMDVLEFLQGLEADGINFRSLSDSIDTKTPAGKAMMHMLAVFAEFERNIGVERTRAGIKRAQASGVTFGQPTIFTPQNQAKIEKWLRQKKPLPLTMIAKRLGCHVGTLRRVYTGPVLDAIRSGRKTPKLKISTKD